MTLPLPTSANERTLEDRLEHGEIVHWTRCPFRLPTDEERAFLFAQRLHGLVHKDIALNPCTGKLTGFAWESPAQSERLRQTLLAFGNEVRDWLSQQLPRYAQGWLRDRITYRPAEETTRKQRTTARNDLLHIDAFPTRPTQGARILRLYVNLNPTDPRVWATSEPFARLLERFGRAIGAPEVGGDSWTRRLGDTLLSLLHGNIQQRSAYDSFMLRLHHHMKADEAFQEKASKRIWQFPPGSAWLAFTDGFSHAELRGRFALEHSFFVPLAQLAYPAEAPAKLLAGPVQLGAPRRAA